jgi:flagellar protein FliL
MKKKKLLIILVPVLLLGGGAGAYFSGALGGGGDDKKAASHGETAKASAHGEKPAHGSEGGEGAQEGHVFYPLPDIVVNLNTAGGRKSNFLKIKINLELQDQAQVAMVEKTLPRVVDNLQIYLRELRIEDIQGSEGLYRLREELLHRVNAAANPARVNDVLFAEMLMQ